MFQPNPPTPQAMSDAELNSKIAALQLQPDGLVAAMSLIEEQSRLRQSDALEYSKWELESQMNAVTSPELETSKIHDPAFPMPAAQVIDEPTIDIFADLSAKAVVPVIEAAFTQEVEEPAIKQPLPVIVSPAPIVENLDDVVAALNASYAAVATEPETKEPETRAPIAEAPVAEITAVTVEQIPEPIEALLTVSNSESDLFEQSLPEDAERAEEQLDKTGTAAAFSFSWLAIVGTPLALVLAAVLKEAGASLAQGFVLLAGIIFLTSVLASVGSMAAARASSSLTIVSRAAFGVWGNSLPATLMFLIKLFWSAALVYFATRVISPLIFNQSWFASVAESVVFPAEFTASLFVVGPILILSGVAAGIGGVVLLRLQQLTALLSLVAIGVFVFFVVTTYSLQDLEGVETLSQTSLIELGLLLAAIFAFALVSVSGDFAKKLPQSTPGAKVFFLTFVSTFFLPLIAGALGLMWLFMAGDTLGSSLSSEVLATVAGSAPIWVFMVFVVALGLSIVHLISASLYSLASSLVGIVKTPGWLSKVGIVVTLLATVLIPSYLVTVSALQESIFELLILAAVVAASWIGIFISDALLRTRGYHEVSLTREYGFYGRVNAANSIGFVLAIALGYGYLDGGPQLSVWTGYLGNLTPEIFELAGSNIGIAMAFGLAVLFPVVLGIPRIKKQEQNLTELGQRREELKEFLDAAS